MRNNDPATSSQLTTLRNWYTDAIGYVEANWYVKKLKTTGFTKSEASREMTRVHALREAGKGRSAKPIGYTPPTADELAEFTKTWCPF